MSRVPAVQRREDFVNAAVRVIAEHGAPGATTRLIAEEADAPLASLHYCFSSKEALFDAVFDALAQRPYDLDVPLGDTGLGDAAASVLARAIEWYIANPEWARARLELFFWALHTSDGDVAVRSFELQASALAEALRRSCGKRDDVELIEQATHLVVSMIDGLLLQWLSREDEAALRGELTNVCDALRALLRPARQRASGR